MLTNRQSKRLELVHEPGQWVEVRMPSVSVIEKVTKDGDHAISLLLNGCVIAWSYEEPVTTENIAALDAQTAGFIVAGLQPETVDAVKND